MKTLHELPQFRDRWSYLYLEYGTLDQNAQGLVFENRLTLTSIPINQLSLVMLGPGTTITHAAVKALAGNNCLLAWTGVDGVKLYAHSTGGTFSARRLIVHRAGTDDPVLDGRVGHSQRHSIGPIHGRHHDQECLRPAPPPVRHVGLDAGPRPRACAASTDRTWSP